MVNLDLNKMSDIIKGLPQYNELLATYTMHMVVYESISIYLEFDWEELEFVRE